MQLITRRCFLRPSGKPDKRIIHSQTFARGFQGLPYLKLIRKHAVKHGKRYADGIRFESDRFDEINGDSSEKILNSHGQDTDKS